MQKQKDGRLIAAKNEFRVLRALQRFGWLRTRDLAALCWKKWLTKPEANLNLAPVVSTASAIRMAQTTLKRLKAKRHVLSCQAPDGSIIYSLAEGGVRVLVNFGVKSQSGKDLTRSFSSAFFRHRCIANEIAISAITQGFRVSTEREISQGISIVGEAGFLGKRPDVIIALEEEVFFIEVERSRKNSKDYKFLLDWIGRAFTNRGLVSRDKLLKLNNVTFICTQAFKSRLNKDLDASYPNLFKKNEFITYSTDLYSFEDILFY